GQYETLYRAQGGRCYICQRATGKSKNLAVDHDHSHCPREQGCKDCVRGLLCSRCNHDLLGHCRDSVEMLQRAIDYLKDPPARRILPDGGGDDRVDGWTTTRQPLPWLVPPMTLTRSLLS